MLDRLRQWRRDLRARFLRRGRTPGLRTAKTTLAAVLSYVLADALNTSSSPVLAPLTALLVVQVTLYRTVAESLQRIVSVLAGVLVAIAVASVVGLTWYSLGAVVAVALVLGRLLRLGPHLLEVPISAMLVLAVGGAESVAAGRVYETLVGAAVGLTVSALVAPPLYLQPAGDAIADLADRMAGFQRDLAAALRSDWSRSAALRWLEGARALGAEVNRADRTLDQAEESARLNPRGAPARTVQPRLRGALTALEHCYVALRELCRALLDRTFFVPEEEAAAAYGEDVRVALAEILECSATAMEAVGDVVPGQVTDVAVVEKHLAVLQAHRDRLSRLLLVDPQADPAAWGQHGALLAAVDWLRVEMESAVRRPEQPWRPPPLVRRPVRRRRRRSTR